MADGDTATTKDRLKSALREAALEGARGVMQACETYHHHGRHIASLTTPVALAVEALDSNLDSYVDALLVQLDARYTLNE